MQVHAVPDSERAIDSTGRRLPWAFEPADPDNNHRRIPEERGPFGKARKRGSSRAKTPIGNIAEDNAKLASQRAIDDIFSQYKADVDNRISQAGRTPGLPQPTPASNLIDAGGLGTSFQAGVPAPSVVKEPKEVILYGYGADLQWAAIDHYEKASYGIIYEEYDREPYNAKLQFSGSASMRASHYSTLPKASLRKVNQYVGGDHWIKVTFDSAEAAERACHYSPKIIQGYKVFAEPYRGTAPTGGDRAIRADLGVLSQTTSPNTVSSATLAGRVDSISSVTASSATATASIPPSTTQPISASDRFLRNTAPWDLQETPEPPAPTQSHLQPTPQNPAPQSTTTALRPHDKRTRLRLTGPNIKPAVFLPREKAFLPARPGWQQTLGGWPVIGWVVGSGTDVVGTGVPRKPDGGVDVEKASLYWRVWYAVDACFGTDFCGVRDAEWED